MATAERGPAARRLYSLAAHLLPASLQGGTAGGATAMGLRREVSESCSSPGAVARGPCAMAVDGGAEFPNEMSDTEKFMFDLQGYLIVPGFLTTDEVQTINDAFDANWHLRRLGSEATKRQGYDQFYGMLEWEQPHCQIFRALLAHPKLVPYLNTMFGRGWKADHEPFMLTGTAEMSAARDSAGDGGMSVHGGTARQFQGHSYYEYNNGQIRNGLSNCVYILRDIWEGDGGIGFVPGSHKANYEVPRDVVQSANYGPVSPVVNPTMKAGDLVIFTEATLHCTLPWINPHHETRRLLYRYAPKYIHMDGGTFEVTQPAWVSELTPAQQAVLEPPYSYARPEVSNDGQSVLPIKRGASPDGRGQQRNVTFPRGSTDEH